MNTRVQALHLPTEQLVEVIQDGEDLAFVKFADGKAIWVVCDVLDFEDLIGPHDNGYRLKDDDWGPENDDTLDSPTDFDEHEMNPDDCLADAGDQYDIEYDR